MTFLHGVDLWPPALVAFSLTQYRYFRHNAIGDFHVVWENCEAGNQILRIGRVVEN